DKISELNSFNYTLEQERDDLNLKKHESEAEVGYKDSEITSLGTKVNELEKVAGKSSYESNIIGEAKEDLDLAKSYKKRPGSLAKQVWKVVRNDSTPNRKRFLDILLIPQMKINPLTQEEHALHFDEFVDILKKANVYQYYIKTYNIAKLATYKEYIYFSFDEWVEKKKYQLSHRLDKEAHDLVKEILKQQGYKQDYISQ
ncbi:4615_t:CDS:2, partial [Dentiscutata heterogama]